MKLRICILAALVFALAGCDYLPFGYTEIKDVVENPATYEGKEIKLKGTVTDVVKVPLIELKMYSIKDNGNEITVITDGDLPSINQKIALKARVSSVAIVGGEAIGLKAREIRRLTGFWR
jgi:hypothetical protein